MRGNNKNRDGFSLIELIIAIAILAIFVGMISLSTALLRSADTRGLASAINDSLTDLKSATESHKGPFYLHIYKTNSGFYAHYQDTPDFTAPEPEEEPLENDERLGSSALTVNIVDGSGPGRPIEGGTSIVIQMRKKDGAYVKKVKKSDSSEVTVPRRFDVINGGTVEYSVFLAGDTGLHYMDRV